MLVRKLRSCLPRSPGTLGMLLHSYAVNFNAILDDTKAIAGAFLAVLVLVRNAKADTGSCLECYMSSDHLLILVKDTTLGQT